jgi:ATP-dependent RNA helicase RhlE
MRFSDLNLIQPIQAALAAKGYEEPTPIQAAAIPPVLSGRDVLGCAQTGTGKTAAFALPILQNLTQNPAKKNGAVRALILSPTRELALQIGESFNAYGHGSRLRVATIFGGVSEVPQKQKLRQGVEILVATPGRLMDLHAQGALSLAHVEIFTLDEADRMMDMGFIHDVRRIAALVPAQRQTLLFSATMPPEIRSLANNLLRDPVNVEVAPVSSTAENIEQSVYMVPRGNKTSLLRHLLGDENIRRALVFTRTKHGADRVCRTLEKYRIGAEAIHGNKTQGARQRALMNFKTGKTRVLVATDIAARGIDVTDVSHVFNFDLPEVPETYVHRIGRTARAGASGVAFAFCDSEERSYLHGIERVIRKRLKVVPTPVLEDVPAPVPQGDVGSMRSLTPPARHHAPKRQQSHGGQRSHHSQGQGHSSQGRSSHRSESSSQRDSHRNRQDAPRSESQEPVAVQHGRKPFWRKFKNSGPNRHGG